MHECRIVSLHVRVRLQECFVKDLNKTKSDMQRWISASHVDESIEKIAGEDNVGQCDRIVHQERLVCQIVVEFLQVALGRFDRRLFFLK